jgi:chromosome segregation ATPase
VGIFSDIPQAAISPKPKAHVPAETTMQRLRKDPDADLPFPQQIAKLKARIDEIDRDRRDEQQELAEWKRRERDLTQKEEKLNDREDELYREIDLARAKARRRERHQLEKTAHGVRVQAIKALASMLPQAKKQAQQGKPALLRLILRSTR